METTTSTLPASPVTTKVELPPLARRVGNTPLLRLQHIAGMLPDEVSVWAKAEFLNPGGSVKDRPALRMLIEGLQSGRVSRDRVLIDATSGNTGIAYAMLGAAFGIRVKLTLPANASPERKQILKAYGVDLVLTDPLEGTDGAQRAVRKLVDQDPDRYFYPDQYNNDANWRAHFDGTGAEVIEQTEGRVTHFVAGLGTTGTFMGTSRRLKRFNPDIICAGVQPDGPLHGLEGLKHLPSAIVPGIYDDRLPDHIVPVSTEEAQDMTRRLSREEGLLVGVSSGANVAAAIRTAQTLEGGVVVTVLCDTGTRYLSDHFWSQA